MKRAFDVAGATVLMVLTAPLLLTGVLMVLVDTGRPVFFAHRRLGLGGRPFRCWKLRTMDIGAETALSQEPELRRRYEEHGYKLPLSTDPRVTPLGRWLRRTHIDEIPQFVNVLRGDMSLVGPRPIVESELELFGPEGEALHTVRPGVFGAWNSLGRRRPPYPERARLELDYVRQRSMRRDLRILARSVLAVLQGESNS